MRKATAQDLAINGGMKTVTAPIPDVGLGVNEVGADEMRCVLDVLERKALFRWQDAQHSYVAKFEDAFARRTGAKYALATASGTGALITALTALGVGPGDEVIVPAYTYIASASAVLWCGAVPVIAEIDDTLTIDPRDVERKITRHTRALMPVHMRGIPCQLDKLRKIAKKHDLLIIEDCAQCDGGTFRGKSVGLWGDAGCFSLQASKTITSGEGGIVITNNTATYARAALAHDSGMAFWRRLSDEHAARLRKFSPFPGNGYRMGELAGAVAFAQLKKLDWIVGTMRKRKAEILAGLHGLQGLRPMRVPDPAGECGVSLNLLFDSTKQAKQFAQALSAEGVRVGTIHNDGFPDRHIYKYWDYVLNKWPIAPNRNPWTDPAYNGNVEYSEDMCPQTMSILSRTVSVAINQQMKAQHAKLIAKAIRKVAEALGYA